MKADDLKHFKELLEEQLDELLVQADHTVVNLLEKDSNAPDLVDRAALESERDYTLRIRDRESRLIRKIKQSLKDIENGTYGICQMCGEDIGIKRLKARPVARHCIVCKSKMEETERAAGF
jgi:DnaK suppressor protein